MVTSQRDFSTGGRNAEDTFYELAKHIGERCVENDGGQINVGELSGVDKKDGETKDCGKHGNLDLRMCGCLTASLASSNTRRNSEVLNSWKYLRKIRARRAARVARKMMVSVERGLSVCEPCSVAFNADVNGAENIRLDLTGSNSESAPEYSVERDTDRLAQPDVSLYDLFEDSDPRMRR